MPAGMPRVTAANTTQGQPATSERTVPLQRFDRKRRTARVKTTTTAKHRTDGILIQPDQAYQGQAQDTQYPLRVYVGHAIRC